MIALTQYPPEHFVYYVKTLSVTLGRRVGGADSDIDVDLGPSKLISRRHARINFDFETRFFVLSALGKNGVTVNGVQHLPGSPPIELPSKCVHASAQCCRSRDHLQDGYTDWRRVLLLPAAYWRCDQLRQAHEKGTHADTVAVLLANAVAHGHSQVGLLYLSAHPFMEL